MTGASRSVVGAGGDALVLWAERSGRCGASGLPRVFRTGELVLFHAAAC